MDLIDIAIIAGLAVLVLGLGLLSTRSPAARPAAPKKASLKLPATKGFPREVVGERLHQDVLAGICGGFSDNGHELDCEAVLRPDGSEVRVEIMGKLVGELTPEDAARFTKELAARGHEGEPVVVGARVTGGWRTSVSESLYEVRLAFGWPLKLPSARTLKAAA